MSLKFRRRGPMQLLPDADAGDIATLFKQIRLEWIDEALCATGTATIRKRRLPAEQVLALVLGMALYRRVPITELVDRLDLVLPGSGSARVARSAVTQARHRLGDQPVRHLFQRCSQKWGHDSARYHAWRGLAVYGVDGTNVRVPDSVANRAHFGGQYVGEKHGDSGYPLVRGVVLMALRSHLLIDLSAGPYTESESSYAQNLWHQIPENALVLVDRGFFDAKVLIPINQDESHRHWLTRAKSNLAFSVVKQWTADDKLIELKVSDVARRQDPSLPKTWQMRAITYKRPGFKPQMLLTSLVDRQKYPAREIVALYHERWELELGFDEVKTDLLDRQEAIRSKTPEGVMQELWAVALAYNLVRLEMERVATALKLEPRRISFIMSLRRIRDEWMWLAITDSPGTIPKKLQHLREDLARFVLPERRNRQFPRQVKIKMSSYDRKRPVVPRAK